MNGHIEYLIGGLLLVVLLSAFAPTIFTNLQNVNTTSGAPSWLPTILTIIVGIGLVLLAWKAFGNK